MESETHCDISKEIEPFIIKDKLNWECLEWDQKKWCEQFQNVPISVRIGSKTPSKEPIWERTCESKVLTLEQFFENARKSDHWMYFDYTHLCTIFSENLPLLSIINWGLFGFPNITGKDSTIWIGTAGAHTPCHMDSYGCNLVAQIMGRKLWLLMPPEETDNLQPTRVPYEESTIYSQLNFFTPNKNILRLRKMYKIILEPGDVLFVPRHWWHYVENLETSISINTWIPLPEDDESRLEEALVRKIIHSLTQNLPDVKEFINVNAYDILEESLNDQLLNFALEKCHNLKKEQIFVKMDFKKIKLISLSEKEIEHFLKERETQFGYKSEDLICNKENFNLTKLLINSLCHPQTVSISKEKLLIGL